MKANRTLRNAFSSDLDLPESIFFPLGSTMGHWSLGLPQPYHQRLRRHFSHVTKSRIFKSLDLRKQADRNFRGKFRKNHFRHLKLYSNPSSWLVRSRCHMGTFWTTKDWSLHFWGEQDNCPLRNYPPDNWPPDNCSPYNCPPRTIVPRIIAPRTIAPREIAPRIIASTLENC